MKVLVLNGPNLDRLGTRQPELYGATTLPELEERLREHAAARGAEVEFLQSPDARVLAEAIASTDAGAIVINPASLTHHAVVLRDAVAACTAPVYEVHITNIHAREHFRRRSVISAVARGVVAGLGIQGYIAALDAAIEEGQR